MHNEDGNCQTHETIPFHSITLCFLGLLAIYFIGYGVLSLSGYFDPAALPRTSPRDDWLYQTYNPLEWLRHL
jgi:hypothetical protein